MSRARALENGRWVIRATNTGATAIVDHRGRVVSRLPERSAGILEGRVENRQGITPYMLWGDGLTLGALLLVCASACGVARRRR
jgi:apolipoprotein N-acyltransferase